MNILESITLHSKKESCDIKTENKKVRDGFIASEGYSLLAVDYCQIELRLLAHFSHDMELCASFSKDVDVFKEIAARWRHKSVELISQEERNLAKQVICILRSFMVLKIVNA
jgi:DNA polymerase-1